MAVSGAGARETQWLGLLALNLQDRGSNKGLCRLLKVIVREACLIGFITFKSLRERLPRASPWAH